MTSTTTCTVTLTKDELADLRAALYEASSYWYSHLRRAQTDTDCELDETGCRYVWEARMKLATQWETVFEQHFRDA
jgi:hypothetical protein